MTSTVHQQGSGECQTSLPMAGPIFSWEEYQAEKARVGAEWLAKPERKTDWLAWSTASAIAMREVDKRYERGFTIRMHRSLAA